MTESKLTADQAIENVDAAAANYKGTRNEHITIVESIGVIKDTIKLLQDQLNPKDDGRK